MALILKILNEDRKLEKPDSLQDSYLVNDENEFLLTHGLEKLFLEGSGIKVRKLPLVIDEDTLCLVIDKFLNKRAELLYKKKYSEYNFDILIKFLSLAYFHRCPVVIDNVNLKENVEFV